MAYAIQVEGLGKRFRRHHPDRPATLKEALLSGLRRLGPAEQFWALRGVSFQVASGCMVGMIGANGAGKSTLLRLIGGVGRPEEGRVAVRGRIGALLDLGAGFHPDLTGRENLFIGGIIAGLTRAETTRQFDSIVAFAELEPFIDNPLRTYSTGMQMRLAFAVAAHIEPEILLIDEVLAVGDLSFQRKCLDRIAQFKAEGCTIILVSHDMTPIQQLCDEVLWLRQGQLVAHGPADKVTEAYVLEMSQETRRRTPAAGPVLRTPTGTTLEVNKNRFGSLEMEIAAVTVRNSTEMPVIEMEGGQPLRVEIEYLAPQPIPGPIFSVSISREDGIICYDTHTGHAGLTLPTLQGRGRVALQLDRLDLNGGQYYIDVGVYEQNWAYAYDYHWHTYPLLIHAPRTEKGVLYPPGRWLVGPEILP